MKTLFALSLIIFLNTNFAISQEDIIYNVIALKPATTSEWRQLITLTGAIVNVRCETADFDDTTRDRVAGFESSKSCLEFLNAVQKYASPIAPLEVWITPELRVDYRINL